MKNKINIMNLDYYCFLEELRKTNELNSREIVMELSEKFGMSMNKAKEIFIDWCSNYKTIKDFIEEYELI